MKQTLIILAIFCIMCSIIWLLIDPSMEPLISIISFIAGLLGLIYSGSNENKNEMKQKGGKKSTNYQSTGTIKVNMKNDKR